jgi:hypothetical protein
MSARATAEEDKAAHWDDVAGVWQRVSLEAPTGTTTDVASAVWWIQAGRSATPGPRLFADIRIPPRPRQLLSLQELQQEQQGRGESKAADGGVSLSDVLRQRASAGVLECVPLDPTAPLPAVTATPPTPVVRCTWRCHVPHRWLYHHLLWPRSTLADRACVSCVRACAQLDYHPPSDDPDTGLAGFVDELTMIETGVYSDYREVRLLLTHTHTHSYVLSGLNSRSSRAPGLRSGSGATKATNK